MQVQKRLLELGYTGSGEPDGNLDFKTQASILNFRNRNGLKLRPTIDDQLLTTLTTAPSIELPLAQVTATAKEVAPKVEAVRTTVRAKFWAKITAWPSLISAGLLAIADRFDDAVNMLAPLRSLVYEVPGWAWLGAAGVVAAMIAYNAGSTEKQLVEGYRAGTVKTDTDKAIAMAEEGTKS